MAIKDVINAAQAATDAAQAALEKAQSDLQVAKAKQAEVDPHLQALDSLAASLTNLTGQLDASARAVYGGMKDNMLALVSQVKTYLDQV